VVAKPKEKQAEVEVKMKRKGNSRYKPMMRKGKKVYVLRDSKHQTGKIKNIKQDKRLKALHSGKRKSKSGKIYYEYRKNR